MRDFLVHDDGKKGNSKRAQMFHNWLRTKIWEFMRHFAGGLPIYSGAWICMHLRIEIISHTKVVMQTIDLNYCYGHVRSRGYRQWKQACKCHSVTVMTYRFANFKKKFAELIIQQDLRGSVIRTYIHGHKTSKGYIFI